MLQSLFQQILVLIERRSHSRYQSPCAFLQLPNNEQLNCWGELGVTGRHSAPCLEPVLTTDRAPAQIRDNPESLRAHGYGNVLVPFFWSKSGEVGVAIKPGLLLSGATTPVDSSPFPPLAFHSRSLRYFFVPYDGRGTRALSSQDTSLTPLHPFVLCIFCLESHHASLQVSSTRSVCWALSSTWVEPMGVTAVQIIRKDKSQHELKNK